MTNAKAGAMIPFSFPLFLKQHSELPVISQHLKRDQIFFLPEAYNWAYKSSIQISVLHRRKIAG